MESLTPGSDLKHLDVCFPSAVCVIFAALGLGNLITCLLKKFCNSWWPCFTCVQLPMLKPVPFWKALSLSHCLPVVLASSGQFKLMTEVGSGITCSTDNNSVAKDSLHHFQVLSYVPRHGGGGERAPGIHTVCACALL